MPQLISNVRLILLCIAWIAALLQVLISTPSTNLEFNKLEESKDGINFVSRTNNNNGISGKVKKLSNIETIKPPVLTIAAGGSVGETFLQDEKLGFYVASSIVPHLCNECAIQHSRGQIEASGGSKRSLR